MSLDPDHEVLEGLLGAYALDAVDDDEAAALERHLSACPRCRAELDQYREVAGALGNSVEVLPPLLWDRIAERLDGATGHGVEGPPELVARLDAPVWAVTSEPAGSLARTQRTRRLARSLAGVAAAAAVAAIAVLSVNLWSANQRVGTLQGAVSGSADGAAVRAALGAPGHTTVTLRSVAGAQLAQLVLLPNGRGYMVESTMPKLPPGETYQLWAFIDGRAISAGLLGPHPGVIAFTMASRRPSAMAVTVEPAGGVSRPTGLAVASGAVIGT
jgi:anti-sigma-K factor RskA